MNKRYTTNDTFFSTWTPAMAYVLGWIVSDGHIQYQEKKKYTLRFELKDKDAIETLQSCLGSNHRVYERVYEDSVTYCLIIGNKQWVEDLHKIGIFSTNKTFGQGSFSIPDDCVRHFIRGLFDGDGSAFLLNRKRGRRVLGSKFCSASEDLIRWVGSLLRQHADLIPKIYEETMQSGNSFFTLRYGARESMSLYDYMYKDAEHFLSRKKSVFEQAQSMKAGIGLRDCKTCGESFIAPGSKSLWCPTCVTERVRQREQNRIPHRRQQRQEHRKAHPIVKRCDECTVEYSPNSGAQKYCESCRPIVQQRQNHERNQRKRAQTI